MASKKMAYLAGAAILLIAVGGLFGCSKKEAAAETNTAMEAPQAKAEKAAEKASGSATEKNYLKERDKAFKRAKEAPASDFVYGLADAGDGVIIKKYNIKVSEEDVEIVIPSEIEGMPVVELGEDAFRGSPVKTVVIPESIKRFGRGLFREARQLQYVKLPTTMTNLPGGFFSGCESLEYFIIPDYITNIEHGVFSSSGLRSIEIPDTVTSFTEASIHADGSVSYLDWDSLFSYCENLEYVKLPNAIKTLCYTFYRCTSLKQVVLPESLETLERNVFTDCKSLEQIDLPNTLTFIEPETFSGSGLRSITIPESVTNVQDLVLYECFQLESITLPDNVTRITNTLRSGKLKRINLPASLQSIEDGAFYNLSSLEELIIPENLTTIDWGETNQAFYNTALPLATQAKLKQLGYPGKFN